MNELLNVLKEVLKTLVLVIYGIGLVPVLLAAVIYFFGYVYDCFISGIVIRIGRLMGRRFPEIKRINRIRNIWNAIQPKEIYTRYETPLLTYCFSYTVIVLISIVFPFGNVANIVVASVVYLLCYFGGMKKRYETNERRYKEVLRNNKAFLRLSFLPLTFLVTILGFFSTVTQITIKDIQEKFYPVQDISMEWLDYGVTDTVSIGSMIMMGIIVILLMYVVSLPIQVIAYYIISVIEYFGNHKRAYIGLLKIFKRVMKKIMKKMFEPLSNVFKEIVYFVKLF